MHVQASKLLLRRRASKRAGARFHKVGLGARDGFQGRFPAAWMEERWKALGDLGAPC